MANTSRHKAPKTRIVDLDDLTREFPPGTQVDRYEIVATLGSGGCGVVYAARHVHLNQTFALKLLHRNLISSEERVERFFREARAAAAVGNPHIVRVSDCGVTKKEVPFLAMEFLKGVVLENLIEESTGLPLDQTVEIGLQVLDGLGAAHKAGVIHRDLKPENIFLVPDPITGKDFVKILDFGVSKMISGADEKVLTSTGALLGTPRYMAPEQFRGARNVDHRADLFAAAVVLFQMLSGQLPFEGDNPLALAHRAATQPPRPLHELTPNLPDDICGVIYRGLEKDPDARWQNARAFSEALRDAYEKSTEEGRLTETSNILPPGCDNDLSSGDSTIPSTPGLSIESTIPSTAGLSLEAVVPDLKDPLDVDLDDPTLPTGELSFGDKDRAAPDEEIPPAAPTRPQAGPLVAGDEAETTLPWGSQGQVTIDPLAPTKKASLPETPLTPPPAEPGPAMVQPIAQNASQLETAAPMPAPSPAPMPAPSPAPMPVDSNQNIELGAATTASSGDTKRGYWKLLTVIFGIASLFSGVILGFILLATGWFDLPSSPEQGDHTVAFGNIRIDGNLDEEAVNTTLRSARPHLEMCRGIEPAQVTLEAQIVATGAGVDRLSVLRPLPADAERTELEQCCIDAFRAGIPEGWNPGNSGVLIFDIILPQR